MIRRKPGDLFILQATGDFAPGVECIVMEVNDDGRIIKARAVVPDERLARHGFILEGEDYIIMEWNWSEN